jgi:hypothetical protein
MQMNQKKLCQYYQAHVDKKMTWFVVATLKSQENIQFDRTIDAEKSIFEFFVPAEVESQFLIVIHKLIETGYVSNLQKMENRLSKEELV